MTNFPPLRAAVLTGLLGLKDHLDTIESPDCPYDGETKAALRSLLAPREIEKIVEKMVESKAAVGRPSKDIRLTEDDQRRVLEEIKDTMEGLKKMDTGDVSLPTNERIQIAKTKTALLDSLLKMMERHSTVQKMQQFQETVVKLLDDLVSEQDREQFMKRLEPYR